MVEQSQGLHRYTIAFEYVSQRKVLETPNSAMAFAGRTDELNVLTICTWSGDENTKENENAAREGVSMFSKIIAAGGLEENEAKSAPKVYGNYGMCGVRFTLRPYSYNVICVFSGGWHRCRRQS